MFLLQTDMLNGFQIKYDIVSLKRCVYFPQGALLKPHIPLLVIALLESLSGLENQVWIPYLLFHF